MASASQPRRTGGARRRRRSQLGQSLARFRTRFELLESRRLLAVATDVAHDFRSDDFSLSGAFSYELSSPTDSNFLDQIPSGNYSSTAGHVDWTSPTLGVGYLEGVATGAGHSSVVYLGSRRGCADYTFRETGRLDFSIDAGASDLTVGTATSTSTAYTQYKDLTGGKCPAPDPPWSRFFGGDPALYDGTFKSSDHSVAVSYVQSGSRSMNVTSPAATINWTNSAATDLTLSAGIYYPDPAAPAGWVELPQTAQVKPVTFVDPESGGVDVTAGVTGKIPTTATPTTPVANLHLYWATSTSDTSGAEIPLTAAADPAGLYWNSLQMTAHVLQLPAAPANAQFVRVVISGAAGIDSTASNSVAYLPIGTFEVANTASPGQLQAGDSLDSSATSLLSPTDLANPDIRVFAFNPVSQLGGSVSVLDDAGGFTYDTADAPGIVALAAGETANDTIEFLAIKNQTLLDRATRTITVVGVNDPPVAGTDQAATTNDQVLNLSLASLLTNDSDPDHNDQVHFVDVATSSLYGAPVRISRNVFTGAIDGIAYDPRGSVDLHSLNDNEQAVDEVTYTIRDDQGLETVGVIEITVTGTQPKLTLLPVADQFIRTGTSLGPIDITVFDPDGDPGDIVVTVQADNATLVPAANLILTGTGDIRSLTINPVAGLSGKTIVTLHASDGASRTADISFQLSVGSADDFDLDGIPDAVENAAPNGGDMNGDGQLDMEQPNVVAAKSPVGSDYLLLLAPAPQAFEQVALRDGTTDPAPPAGITLPLGALHFELALQGTNSVGIALRTNLSNPPANRLLRETGGTTWTNGMLYQGQGGELHSDQLNVAVTDGGWFDASPAADHRVAFDGALAHADHPWQSNTPLDVNNDHAISPVDALVVINELNGIGTRPLGQLPPIGATIPAFLDTNGDNYLSAVDALLVINHLNGLSGEGTAEGEGSPVRSVATVPARVPAAVDANPDTHAAALADLLQDWDNRLIAGPSRDDSSATPDQWARPTTGPLLATAGANTLVSDATAPSTTRLRWTPAPPSQPSLDPFESPL